MTGSAWLRAVLMTLGLTAVLTCVPLAIAPGNAALSVVALVLMLVGLRDGQQLDAEGGGSAS